MESEVVVLQTKLAGNLAAPSIEDWMGVGRIMEDGNIVMPREASLKDIYKQYSFMKANSSA